MTNVAVIGSQWGDEGKGKIVDWLSEEADVIVRFQGGHNAGHTLVIDGKVYKLSLLPSGVVRKGKLSVIGNGVVIDPTALLKEMDTLRSQGVDITPENLMIAENAQLILSLHQSMDQAAEATRGNKKIGTTGRGIGPAYEDKVARRGLRMCDLADKATRNERLTALVAHHNAMRKGLGAPLVDQAEIEALLDDVTPALLPFIQPAWRELNIAAKQGKRILFEGAQGMLLDCDHGTYPYVTSSNTVTGAAFTGSGLGAKHLGYVLGITKAYTTRVGEGPFPTELNDAVGQRLGERGHEFGTVTGRQRRCGWFDAVLVRQAVDVAGIDGIAFTKLDVLDGLDEINVCVGYQHGDDHYDYLPANSRIQAEITPIYETLEGWSESTEGVRRIEDLPAAAVTYIRRIEALIGATVAVVSTSPERDDTILLKDPFSA